MNLTHLSLTRVRPADPVPAPPSNQDRLREFRHALIEVTEQVIGNAPLSELLRRVEAARDGRTRTWPQPGGTLRGARAPAR